MITLKEQLRKDKELELESKKRTLQMKFENYLSTAKEHIIKTVESLQDQIQDQSSIKELLIFASSITDFP
jgi:F0F1-type ATP synthase membrane subunit b/b'